jgi:hypothetical protein
LKTLLNAITLKTATIVQRLGLKKLRRFRKFTYEEILARDITNMDISGSRKKVWLILTTYLTLIFL